MATALRAGQLEDGQPDRRLAVERAALVLALGAQLDPADVAEPGDLPVGAGLDDDVGELLGIGQPAERVHGVLEVQAGGHRRLADLPGRHLHVLLAQGADHVAGGQVAGGQLLRVEPDPHAVVLLAEEGHVAHALQPRQLVLDAGSWRSCSGRAGRSARRARSG